MNGLFNLGNVLYDIFLAKRHADGVSLVAGRNLSQDPPLCEHPHGCTKVESIDIPRDDRWCSFSSRDGCRNALAPRHAGGRGHSIHHFLGAGQQSRHELARLEIPSCTVDGKSKGHCDILERQFRNLFERRKGIGVGEYVIVTGRKLVLYGFVVVVVIVVVSSTFCGGSPSWRFQNHVDASIVLIILVVIRGSIPSRPCVFKGISDLLYHGRDRTEPSICPVVFSTKIDTTGKRKNRTQCGGYGRYGGAAKAHGWSFLFLLFSMMMVSKSGSNDICTKRIIMVGLFQGIHLGIDHMEDDIGKTQARQYQYGYLSDTPSCGGGGRRRRV
mmetsp:Transcript_14490/g.27166  ORF Transcript_14490/g.27166 Transcript_14490/m.27166 type:complete len:328 (+) Transcript_14490:928-1911(+)